ncbi:hypothetical protein FQN57_004713 [Myotisia sp. PD_48]|nr:hypothetical protein FQN57_004713 [Myotisia sp. PD_48]
MQYVRSLSGSVSKTWNSINPATLSGAIDVIVIEQEDGTLACSPFHVRFGKFSLLRPYEKKVEFCVNGVKQNYAMKLGEGGEAFFVFETTDDIPESLQTSPVISPTTSPETSPKGIGDDTLDLPEPEYLDLASKGNSPCKSEPYQSVESDTADGNGIGPPASNTKPTIISSKLELLPEPMRLDRSQSDTLPTTGRSQSPPPLSKKEAYSRAISLSKKLSGSNIPSRVTESGDLMLDMTGYKSSEEDALRAELIARRILAEELEGNYDIGALIGADEHGNLWIYSSEDSKEAANRKASYNSMHPHPGMAEDAISDPGYHSDGDKINEEAPIQRHHRSQSDAQLGYPTPPQTPTDGQTASRSYAKTLRLTSDQLKALDLKPGANPMTFSVNKATCPATMYLWDYITPIVISDIDGTITKSDALGHVLNMIGRDWTHLGVAKLYTDIASNGFRIMYLTSRSTGQADTTRAYLNGIVQDGYKLPKGPVIMSPDRTIAALRREIYLRKPEVFKMACLRDIQSLFRGRHSPFYAGFGNRLTDALSYRSVNIPSTRIFTINSYAEVSLDLLSLNKYKSSYVTMRELVDHFFPPVSTLVQEGGEEFTDFTYWRDVPRDIDAFSTTNTDIESESELEEEGSQSDGEGSDASDIDEVADELRDSYISQESGGMADSMIGFASENQGDYSDENDDEDENDEFYGDNDEEARKVGTLTPDNNPVGIQEEHSSSSKSPNHSPRHPGSRGS